MSEFSCDTLWSKELYSVADIVSKFNFPLIAQVHRVSARDNATGQSLSSGDDVSGSFSTGDLLKFHDSLSVKVLEGSIVVPNYESTPVHIPLSLPIKLKVVPKKDPSHVYHRVSDLVQDFPHAVVVGKSFSVGSRVAEEGDILELCAIDKRCTQTGVKEFLSCKHNERDIALAMDMVGNFTLYPDKSEYTISEFVTRYRLPQRVKLIGTREELFRRMSRNLLNLVSLLPEFQGEFNFDQVASHSVVVASTTRQGLVNKQSHVECSVNGRNCQIVTIPDTCDELLCFSVAVNQYRHPQNHVLDGYFRDDVNIEQLLDNLFIEFANKPSIVPYAQFETLTVSQPPLLPRKPITRSDDDDHDYEYIDSNALQPDWARSSTEHDETVQLQMSPSSLKTSVSVNTISASTPEIHLLPKHKKFLHGAKTMFSQSLDNLADRLHKKKPKSPEQPRLEISNPVVPKSAPVSDEGVNNNYENIYHSLQARQPLAVRTNKGTPPKVGIALPQNFGTMIGTEENTDAVSPTEDRGNVLNSGASSQHTDVSQKRAQPNDYAYVDFPYDAKPAKCNEQTQHKPTLAPKPRMGLRHATDKMNRRTSGDMKLIAGSDVRTKHIDSSAAVIPPKMEERTREQGQARPTITIPPSESVSIRSIYDIPADLNGLSVENIAAVMKVCGLDSVGERFGRELVDGSLFMELNEDMLREHFSLSKFEILKVMRIQKGYRPKL